MNDRQRQYTVREINSCNSYLRDNEKRRRSDFISALFWMILTWCCFKDIPFDLSFLEEHITNFDKIRGYVGFGSSALCFANCVDLFDNFCKRTSLENLRTNLAYNLCMSDLEEDENKKAR